MKSDEQYAYFAIYGDFEPEDITQIVGVQPTSFQTQGSLNPKRINIAYQESS